MRAGQLKVGAGEARDDARCRQANIRAIVAIADAFDHLGHFLFAEAGVSAGVACFRARITGGDAFNRDRVIGGRIHGVCVEHLLDVTHAKNLRLTLQRIRFSLRLHACRNGVPTAG